MWVRPTQCHGSCPSPPARGHNRTSMGLSVFCLGFAFVVLSASLASSLLLHLARSRTLRQALHTGAGPLSLRPSVALLLAAQLNSPALSPPCCSGAAMRRPAASQTSAAGDRASRRRSHVRAVPLLAHPPCASTYAYLTSQRISNRFFSPTLLALAEAAVAVDVLCLSTGTPLHKGFLKPLLNFKLPPA